MRRLRPARGAMEATRREMEMGMGRSAALGMARGMALVAALGMARGMARRMAQTMGMARVKETARSAVAMGRLLPVT